MTANFPKIHPRVLQIGEKYYSGNFVHAKKAENLHNSTSWEIREKSNRVKKGGGGSGGLA